MTRQYHCPRCKNETIIDHGDRFDCPLCNQEFEEKDFDLFGEENILSIEEKLRVVKALMDEE